MTKTIYRTGLKITDREIDNFMEARGDKPLSREDADLHVAAIFLTTAHRHRSKGAKLEETRALYKRLCEQPGLVDELRRRNLLLGPLIAP
jgi:hypothetical protein